MKTKQVSSKEYHLFTSEYVLILFIIIALGVCWNINLQKTNPQAFFNFSLCVLGWYLANIVNIVYKSINNEFAIKIKHLFGFMAAMFVVYSLVYYSLYNLDKQSFTGSLLLDNQEHSESGEYFDMMYFTMSVFSTAGFGDITPVSRAARSIVMTQFFAGFALVGILLSRVCD